MSQWDGWDGGLEAESGEGGVEPGEQRNHCAEQDEEAHPGDGAEPGGLGCGPGVLGL